MNPGELRHQVVLQSSTSAADSYGQMIQTWATYATVWSKITPLSGRELESAQQISEEITYEITIRYNALVASEQRILFGARIFEIVTSLNKDEKNEYLELFCKEIK